MSDYQHNTVHYIEYGSKPFLAILISLFLAGFAIFSSLYCVQPLMPVFTQFFKISPTESSLSLSVSTIALAIGLLFTGLISDRFGRKPIMVYSLFFAAILLILSTCFPQWHLFLVTRILLGLTVSGVAAVAMTYMGEEIAQKDVGLAMGLYISGTAIGGMGGRLIAGVLVDFMSWQSATLIIAIINLLISFIFYLLLPESKHFKAYPIHFSRFKTALLQNIQNRKLCLLFLQGFILMGCFVSVFNYMSYHLLEDPFQISQAMIGLISIAYLSGIYSSPRAAIWSRKLGRDRVLMIMLLLMMAALFIMLTCYIGLILFGLIIFTFAFFAAHSTVSSWVAIQSSTYKAMASSLYLFFYYLGSSVLGSSSGVIWEYQGWFGLIAAIEIILLLGIFIALYLKRYTRLDRWP